MNPAELRRWIDADTAEIRVELPFNHLADVTFRLYGIQSYELGTEAGKFAALMVNNLLPPGWPCTVRSYKPADSFGRWLATIVTPAGININRWLIAEGLAVEYYGGKKPTMPEWAGPKKGTPSWQR